jgi:hypothetical protein
MSHSLVKVWIHAIFATKDRASMIKDIFEAQNRRSRPSIIFIITKFHFERYSSKY